MKRAEDLMLAIIAVAALAAVIAAAARVLSYL